MMRYLDFVSPDRVVGSRVGQLWTLCYEGNALGEPRNLLSVHCWNRDRWLGRQVVSRGRGHSIRPVAWIGD
jgi:hypothetical protein